MTTSEQEALRLLATGSDLFDMMLDRGWISTSHVIAAKIRDYVQAQPDGAHSWDAAYDRIPTFAFHAVAALDSPTFGTVMQSMFTQIREWIAEQTTDDPDVGKVGTALHCAAAVQYTIDTARLSGVLP